jgi:hypothetical protein
MKIEILGTGCPKCNLLEATAKAAADSLGIDYEIDHVRDINEFMRRGVMIARAGGERQGRRGRQGAEGSGCQRDPDRLSVRAEVTPMATTAQAEEVHR